MPAPNDIADLTLFDIKVFNTMFPMAEAGILSRKTNLFFRSNGEVFIRMTDVIYPHRLFLNTLLEVEEKTQLEFRNSLFSVFVKKVRVDVTSEIVQSNEMQFLTFIELRGALSALGLAGQIDTLKPLKDVLLGELNTSNIP